MFLIVLNYGVTVDFPANDFRARNEPRCIFAASLFVCGLKTAVEAHLLDGRFIKGKKIFPHAAGNTDSYIIAHFIGWPARAIRPVCCGPNPGKQRTHQC